jgi:transposase
VTFIQKKERAKKKNKQLTILNITDELWNEIKSIFPKEKPLKTIGSRPIIPYRKVIDGIIYVLRTEDVNGKMLPKEYGSGFYLSP